MGTGKSFETFFKLASILLLFGLLLSPSILYARYQEYPPNFLVTLGEFLYNDDFTASTDDCTITVKDPNGSTVVNNVTMTDQADGWHYYAFTPSPIEGTWPAVMSCGTIGVDLIKQDKTFIITSGVATTTIAQSVWNVATSTINNTGTVGNHINSTLNAPVASVASNVVAVDAKIESASTSISSMLPALLWGYSSRTLSSFGTLVSDIWSAGTRSLTTFGSLVADVWTAGTRTLTGAGLDTGSLATLSDVQTASTSIATVVNANTNSVTSGINANTDSAILTASTSLAAVINANTNSATANITSDVNTNTDNRVAIATSSLAAVINANTNSVVTTATTSLMAQITSSITSIPASVWAYGSRTLSSLGTLASDVWGVATSTLNGAGTIGKQIVDNLDVVVSTIGGGSLTVGDIWNYGTRTLTGAGLTTGSLATLSDITTATSSLSAVINANTNSVVTTATTSLNASLGAAIAAVSGSWTVRMSDTERVQGGYTYRTKVYVVDGGIASDAYAVPVVTLYDANRNVVVSSVPMTDIGAGVYEYTYSVASGAAQGAWETVISTEVLSGQTIEVNDYWEVASSPAQVIINSISDDTVPSVSANVTITNEGLSGYEYQYEWCVVSDINNACGGGDDVYHAIAAKFINPSEDFNTTLSTTVPTVGNYYFKLVVYFGTDSSTASRSFTAIDGSTPSAPAGGGGGGGGASTPSVAAVINSETRTADFNSDGKVNSIDFSILLAFWKTNPPFRNTKVDINKDNKVDSVDFSILLYQWDKK